MRRIEVALPSIALGLLWWELDLALVFTGAVGMDIDFVLPALLHPKALARCQGRRDSSSPTSSHAAFEFVSFLITRTGRAA
jgi:hypothetical protein